LVRAAKLTGLKARLVEEDDPRRLRRAPTPAIIRLKPAGFTLLGGIDKDGGFRVVDPVTQAVRRLTAEELEAEWTGELLLVTRRLGTGTDRGPSASHGSCHRCGVIGARSRMSLSHHRSC